MIILLERKNLLLMILGMREMFKIIIKRRVNVQIRMKKGLEMILVMLIILMMLVIKMEIIIIIIRIIKKILIIMEILSGRYWVTNFNNNKMIQIPKLWKTHKKILILI